MDEATKGHHSHLMKWGIFYVPTNCESEPSKCKVHINYHGCMYKIWSRREKWANLININEYAESNDIVVFYP